MIHNVCIPHLICDRCGKVGKGTRSYEYTHVVDGYYGDEKFQRHVELCENCQSEIFGKIEKLEVPEEATKSIDARYDGYPVDK